MSIILDGTNGITSPVETTGVITATSIVGLTTPLSVAQGGTGVTAVGTSGNVLTSNGTAWVSQAGGVADGSITDPKVASLSAGTTYIPLTVFDYGIGGGVQSTTYTKRNEFVAFRSGTFRFTGTISNLNTGTPTTMTVSCQIYLNGVATGSIISASLATNTTSGTLTFTDVTVAKGDLVQFYTKGSVATASALLASLNIGNSVAWGFNALSSAKFCP